IVFLRLRKSTRRGFTRVWSVAPLSSRGLLKLDGMLVPAMPGGEAAALGSLDQAAVDALSADGAVILVGERLASSPGALSAAAALPALVVGGVDPDDVADPKLAAEAFARAGFIVSLEIRRSAVTEHADVVLPVAPAAEKAGRYVTWEGRRRPFDLTINNGGA